MAAGVHSQDRWNQLRAAGLLPGVASLADYTEKTSAGLAAAQWLAQELCGTTPPDPALIRDIHRVAFAEVVPFAGEFRKDNGVMIGGYPGADTSRISYEIALLNRQYSDMLADDHTPAGCAAAVAFYHIRLMRIHPFRDGNGRTGRVLLAAQCDALFTNGAGEQVMAALAADKPAYYEALRSANRLNLAPLAAIVTQALGMEGSREAQSPFRVAPIFQASYGAEDLDADLSATRTLSP